MPSSPGMLPALRNTPSRETESSRIPAPHRQLAPGERGGECGCEGRGVGGNLAGFERWFGHNLFPGRFLCYQQDNHIG